jgi:hypothetical protein
VIVVDTNSAQMIEGGPLGVMGSCRTVVASLLLLLCVSSVAHAQDDDLLPPGPNKETVVQRCSFCHSVKNILAAGKQTPDFWRDTVKDMAGQADWPPTDPDIKKITDYLVATFGKSEDPAAKTAAQDDLLPPGPGRDTVVQRCSFCHSVKNILAAGKQTADFWRDTVKDMADQADWSPTDPDIEKIIDYLVATFGKLKDPAGANAW